MELENLYPEAAHVMLDHIDDVLHTHGADVSEVGIMRMSDDLVQRSMMGGDPPRGHSQSTLNDLARLLILQRLIEQGAVPVFPYAPFFPYTPFFTPFVPVPRPRPLIRPVRPHQQIRPPMRPR